jgi:hypothetical protein
MDNILMFFSQIEDLPWFFDYWGYVHSPPMAWWFCQQAKLQMKIRGRSDIASRNIRQLRGLFI